MRHCLLRRARDGVWYRFVVTARSQRLVGHPSLLSNVVALSLPTPTTPTTPIASTPTTTPSTSNPSPVDISKVVHDALGHAIEVQLPGVVDPAIGASIYFVPYFGDRYLGVDFTLTNISSASVTTVPTLDATVTGSDGRTYDGIYDNVSECTNLADLNYVLAPGGVSSGCVVFQLAPFSTFASVQYSLTFAQVDSAQWSFSPAS